MISHGMKPASGLLLVALLAWLMLPTPVLAHGGGTPQLTNASAGPYRVFVWTEPEPWRAHDAHITVAVTLPPPADAQVDESVLSNQLEQPVTDAHVTIRLAPATGGGAPIELVAVNQELLGGAYYEIDTELPAAGMWQVEIDVQGALGTGTVSFATEALPPQRVNWLWLGLGAAAVLALAGLFGLRKGNEATARPGMRRATPADVG
jgi:hypothetical protein